METNVYFEDIHTQIISELKKAEKDITIAVAWFTDEEIFRTLCQRARTGISVKLLITDDHINRKNSRIVHQQLVDAGGEFFWDQKEKSRNIMHHKFCVIDFSDVITGSYNWTKRARDNNEDVVIISDAGDLAFQYLETFNQLLKANGFPIKSIPRLDNEAIAKRLELIRNLISLTDFDDIPTQLKKLRTAPSNSQLSIIIELLEQQDFPVADQHILDYLTHLRAIAVFRDPKIEQLRQELLTLEFQVTALSDQKIECEKKITAFMHQHHQVLGDLIRKYLELKSILAEQRVEDIEDEEASEEEVEQAKEEAEEAEKEYREYSGHYQKMEEEEPPVSISKDDQKRLKSLYRKASRLCHPDKVDEGQKAEATEIFKRLQKANKQNDFAEVEAIYIALKTGATLGDRAMSLSELEQLQSAVTELKVNVDGLRAELSDLMTSDIWVTLTEAKDWDAYFSDKKSQLENQVSEMEMQLQELGI
jgi:hypothetical protein